jgi:VCBS repeat-containing protein
MTDLINAGDKNPAYATYVGRVGALALALGIGAAMATGHGLGLGVAYATEGDPPSDTSQDNDANDNEGDGTDTTPAPPSGTTLAPSGSSEPRSPLARIASVPKMIFNATGGARTSSTGSTPKQLPKLQDVIEDVTSAITGNLPKAAPSTGAAAGQTNSPGSTTSQLAGSGSNNVTPTVSSVPETVTRLFHAPTAAPNVPSGQLQTRATTAPSPGNIVGNLRQAFVDNGQQDVAQPSAALVQTPTTPPPVNPVGVVTRLLTVAFSGLVAPGPAAPTDPPLLLGVLAWARREIQLNFFNRTPNAIPDAVTTGEDPVTPVAGNVLTNDRQENPDGSTEKLVVTDARTQITDKGTLVLNADGSYTYTPKPNANGQDVFTYTVSDEPSRPHIHGLQGLLYGGGHTDTATLTINITPVNDAPIAGTDPGTTTVDEDDTLIGTLPSATDIDSTTLTYSGPTNDRTDHGTITITPTGGYTYEPDADYYGPDTITYTVSDNNATSPKTTTGTLAVTVNPVNDAPVAGQDPGGTTVNEDGTLTGTLPTASDIDNTTSSLTYSAPDSGRTQHGTITITPAGSYTYEPDADYYGPDTITYTVSDNHPTDPRTATGTLSVTVNPVDDAPTVEGLLNMSGTPVTEPVTLTSDKMTMAVSPDGSLIVGPEGSGTGLVYDGHEFVNYGTPVWNHSVTYDGLVYYQGAEGTSGGFSDVTTEDISSGSFHGVKVTEKVGDNLLLERVIGFYDGEEYAIVATRVTNVGTTSIDDVAVMENTDPDQGYGISSDYETSNDVVLDGQFVRAAYTDPSYPGGLTLGFGSADPRATASAEGFSNTYPYSVIGSPADPNGAIGDIGINLATDYGTLAPGQSASSGMLIVLGKSTADADQTYLDNASITQTTV